MSRTVTTCTWKRVNAGDDEFYETECGASWTFDEGDCKDNQMNYCMRCGRKIKEKKC